MQVLAIKKVLYILVKLGPGNRNLKKMGIKNAQYEEGYSPERQVNPGTSLAYLFVD